MRISFGSHAPRKSKKKDIFYISTGKAHAIGTGVLLAKIQQTSDVTYRIYNHNSRDTQTN